jgi:hypothetical protein
VIPGEDTYGPEPMRKTPNGWECGYGRRVPELICGGTGMRKIPCIHGNRRAAREHRTAFKAKEGRR